MIGPLRQKNRFFGSRQSLGGRIEKDTNQNLKPKFRMFGPNGFII